MLEFRVLTASRLRRVTASRLLGSVRDKPAVTLHRRVPADNVLALLQDLRQRDGASPRHTLTSVLAVVVAEALARDQRMNSCIHDGEMRRFDEVHLAVAIATDDGLIPPVLRPKDLASFRSAAEAIERLSELARGGRLHPSDLTPSTFTLTSLGSLGIEYFTPILNPPHVGILGVGGVQDAGDRGASIPLSLTFDHAGIDGVEGALFLQEIEHIVNGLTVGQECRP